MKRILVCITVVFIFIGCFSSCRLSKMITKSDGGVDLEEEYQIYGNIKVKKVKISNYSELSSDISVLFSKALLEARNLLSDDINKPVKVIIELEKGKTYKISKPILIDELHDIEINGNGSLLLNIVRGNILQITNSQRITFRDISIDYDPLPFTQGVITAMNETTTEINVKVDKGYPIDPLFLYGIKSGFFMVMDRRTKALKEGARNFVSPRSVEKISEDTIKVKLSWPLNECGNGQVPAKVGDVITLRTQTNTAIKVQDCAYTSLINVNLYSSPGMGILENGGFGGMSIVNCNIIPGSKPEGAEFDRLCSTNSDGSHFITVQNGPLIQGSKFYNTSDDCVNVQGFYYFVLDKVNDKTYYVTPKWDIGLEKGDTIEALDKENFNHMGISKILNLKKLNKPELKEQVKNMWSGRSSTTQPDMVYEITLSDELNLSAGDAITSLTRLGKNTVIKNSEFRAGGRVICKGPNTVIENNKFSYSNYCALHVGSDIGYWAESNFANGVVIKNNTFDFCNVGANTAFDGEVNATVFVSMTAPLGTIGFFENTMNKNITIEKNIINNSYNYGLVITNADNVTVKDNIINEVFIRGDTFSIGRNYDITPDSGIFAAMIKNAQFIRNTVYSKTCAIKAITVVDNDTMIGSVALDKNKFSKEMNK